MATPTAGIWLPTRSRRPLISPTATANLTRPTSIGPNGVVYALNGGTLFALGGYSNYTLTNVTSQTPAVVGQPVTFTTTLASTNGGPVPTGNITYTYTSGINTQLKQYSHDAWARNATGERRRPASRLPPCFPTITISSLLTAATRPTVMGRQHDAGAGDPRNHHHHSDLFGHSLDRRAKRDIHCHGESHAWHVFSFPSER